MNIGTFISRHGRYRPHHPAVIFEGKRLSYRQFNKEINRAANAFLKLGVKKGDKIATLLSNSVELLEIYWACAKIGAVVVPMSTLLKGRGLSSLLKDSDSIMIITKSDYAHIFEEVRDELTEIKPERVLSIDPIPGKEYGDYKQLKNAASDEDPKGIEITDEDLFNIIYSSGTTGQPKGIVHTHYVRAMYCTVFASLFRMTPESVVLQAGSIVFNGSFVTMMPTFFLGATYVLMRQFEVEEFIELIHRERVTHVMMVPSQIVAMIQSEGFKEEKLGSLEMVLSLGAPLHRRHKEELNRVLPGRFYELYGLTEGFVTVLDRDDYERKPDSVGVPPPFFEMRIMDEEGRDLPPGEVGEIVGRGPILMPRYYKRPDLTSETIVDGWLHSGDLGYIDEDGFLYLVDRKKDMIISGGVNVYPRDIEEVIVQHPEVQEAAVFGIPSDKWGETPMAAVVLKRPGAVTEEELKQWVNERVGAKYQRIHSVTILEEFPRNVAGKILKRLLREPYWKNEEEKL